MSNSQGAFGCGASPFTRGRWTAVELIAMVLGFMIFWPLGLAVLAFKYWQYRSGGPDLRTVATSAFQRARSTFDGFAAQAPRGAASWTSGFATSSGNAAFDAWKSTELQRLEEERRRLEQAHREFAEWLDNVRRAKDREEFDRFMRERRGGAQGAAP